MRHSLCLSTRACASASITALATLRRQCTRELGGTTRCPGGEAAGQTLERSEAGGPRQASMGTAPARIRSSECVRRIGSPLIWNLSLDELREQCE